MLDEMKGSVRKHELVLRHFKSLKRLKEADIKEITDLGINRKTAENIQKALSENIIKIKIESTASKLYSICF